MNKVTYWVSTGSPVSVSALSTATVRRVPEPPTRTLYGLLVVEIDRPGTSGWWKCMSCSPCTMNMAASGGIMSPTASNRVPHTGTTPNTGGATLPAS